MVIFHGYVKLPEGMGYDLWDMIYGIPSGYD